MGVKKNKVKEAVDFNLSDVKETIKKRASGTGVVKQNKIKHEIKSFNTRALQNRLCEEYAHISNIFDILSLNIDTDTAQNGFSEDGDKDDAGKLSGIVNSNHLESVGKNDIKSNKIKSFSPNGNILKISWPKTVEGLEEAKKLFKGRKLTYQERLLKRNLKNRLSRKKKKQELQIKRALKKGGKEGLTAEDLVKNKKIKPVFNSEGKIVSTKYDFSEIGAKKDFAQKSKKVINQINLSKKNVNEQKSKSNMNNLYSKFSIESDTDSFSKNVDKNSTKQQDNKKKKRKGKVNGNINKSSAEGIVDVGKAVVSDSSHEPVKKKFKINEQQDDTVNNQTILGNTETLENKFKPIFNKDNKMVFSKIEFPDIGLNKKIKKKEDKDPRKLLLKLKANKAKLSELENSGDKEKAFELKEKEKWVTALKKASGEKVKDDPQLLKKSIIREKSRKMHSKKKWDARVDAVKKKQQEKQTKRTENIMAKRKEKKKKKLKKAIKKGRYIPK